MVKIYASSGFAKCHEILRIQHAAFLTGFQVLFAGRIWSCNPEEMEMKVSSRSGRVLYSRFRADIATFFPTRHVVGDPGCDIAGSLPMYC
jgi:hypothetical protein